MGRKIVHNLILLFIATNLIISCSTPPPADETKTIRMVYTDWSESVAITHLAARLLENDLGYVVELKLTDVAGAYKEVASGKADFFADAWLPETHQLYFDQYEGEIEQVGITFPEARTGFVVPDYSRLQTISDLKSYPNPVIGIDTGAGVMQKARQAIEKYNLPVKLLSLSEKEMISQFEDSIKRRKEIVITGWDPHWIFTRYDIRFLEDPDALFGTIENIYTIGHSGIEESLPRAVRFFERMQLNENQLNQLVYQVMLSDDPEQGVKNWIDENEYIVNQWVKNLQPERKKIM